MSGEFPGSLTGTAFPHWEKRIKWKVGNGFIDNWLYLGKPLVVLIVQPICMKAITVLVITGLWMSMGARAQTAAAWNFSGSSVAPSTIGANITATNVTQGPDVTGGGQFSGSDYFGQDGWPATTTIDPNAYMQFTVSPNSGF